MLISIPKISNQQLCLSYLSETCERSGVSCGVTGSAESAAFHHLLAATAAWGSIQKTIDIKVLNWGDGDAFSRSIKSTSEMDNSVFKNLKNESVIDVGRSGSCARSCGRHGGCLRLVHILFHQILLVGNLLKKGSYYHGSG